jgi:hypothetical protein
MKRFSLLLFLMGLLAGCKTPSAEIPLNTYCNPVDISYRFCLDEPSRREAADPSVVWFKDRYYLFASKSGGYWHSKDLNGWSFVETNEIPVEEYAPTAVAIGDTLYFLASSNEKSTLYRSTDPMYGQWEIAREELNQPVWDPAFFMDDDNRLYLYWGCSDVNPIYGVEIDYKNHFDFMGEPTVLVKANPEKHGWEVPGDYNTLTGQRPWIEGAWMNKHNGQYYLQYSGPGTEFKSYSDGVYTSANPLGPYQLAAHNPFALKPEGFAAGAGHGSTFKDRYGNYWHIGTITISVKHMFERRLGIYPTFFDEDGLLYANTRFGDYPLIMPTHKVSGYDELFPGWMLLSYNKSVEVSSSADGLPASNMTDENIRTYWSAASGDSGEYAIIDLQRQYDVYALQINFAEHNTSIYGRQVGLVHRYTVEWSKDGDSWEPLINRSTNRNDNSHAYFQLTEMVNCRYLKIVNLEVPDGCFAMSGFRVFGKGNGSQPDPVKRMEVVRNPEDRRSVKLTWEKPDGAIGYNISYGSNPGKLYHDYMVYQDTVLQINSLHADRPYYFMVEAFNENGMTDGEEVIRID